MDDTEHDLALSEEERMLLDMERREIINRIAAVALDVDDLIYKSKYFQREITEAAVEDIHNELRKIIRTFDQ